MATQFSRTWWGQKFIAALESFSDSGRLARGRTYARGSKVKDFAITDGEVIAHVRGSVNPYFGVYKEPLYTTKLQLKPISPANWAAAIAFISSKAGYLSKLLMNEMPDDIERAFATLGIHLLPKKADFKVDCSCPDWGDPCKHGAGVCYLLAAELDRDPFLLFELRGLSRSALQEELAKSPLGQALLPELQAVNAPPQAVESYYPAVLPVEPTEEMGWRDFWQGSKRLPKQLEPPVPSLVAAVLVKKQGDSPAFWQKDASFIAAMEELYDKVKTKNKDLL